MDGYINYIYRLDFMFMYQIRYLNSGVYIKTLGVSDSMEGGGPPDPTMGVGNSNTANSQDT